MQGDRDKKYLTQVGRPTEVRCLTSPHQQTLRDNKFK